MTVELVELQPTLESKRLLRVVAYIVKGQSSIIFLVKSQSKYLAGQTFDQEQRLEYMMYRSIAPLHIPSAVASFSAITLQ